MLLILLLAQDVAEAYRQKTAALIAQYASPKSKIHEAAALALKLDETVVEELAAKFKSTPDAVRDAWKKRERKPKKVQVGDGSWLLLDGQNGGLDSDVKGTPRVERDIADDLMLMLGGWAIYNTSPMVQWWLDLNAARAHVASDPNLIGSSLGAICLGQEVHESFV